NRTAITAPIANGPRCTDGTSAARVVVSLLVAVLVSESTGCVVVIAQHHAGASPELSPRLTMWKGLRTQHGDACHVHGYSRSIAPARSKSFSVIASSECVVMVTFRLLYPKTCRSGWWFIPLAI